MSFEEEKAHTRQIGYRVAAVASVAGPALAVALAEGGVKNWSAVIVAIITSLTAGGGLIVASRKTGQQINSGKFSDTAPDPVTQVIDGLQIITGTAQQAIAARDTVTQAAAEALGLGVEVSKKASRALDEVLSGLR